CPPDLMLLRNISLSLAWLCRSTPNRIQPGTWSVSLRNPTYLRVLCSPVTRHGMSSSRVALPRRKRNSCGESSERDRAHASHPAPATNERSWLDKTAYISRRETTLGVVARQVSLLRAPAPSDPGEGVGGQVRNPDR